MRKWVSALLATIVLVVALGFTQEVVSSPALTVVLFCVFLVMFVAVLLIALLGTIDNGRGRLRQGVSSIDSPIRPS